MFKISKLENVKNEVVSIDYVTQEQSEYENGKKVSFEAFKTLSFDIFGNDYSFGFDLNCKLEKLLEIPMNETIDFKDYIFGGETWLNVKGLNGVEPQMDIKITRYLKNRFIIFLTFYTDYSYDENDYSGMMKVLNENKGKRIAIISHSTAIAFLLKKWCEVYYDKEYKFNDNAFFNGKWEHLQSFKLEFKNNELLSIKVV